MDFAKEGTCKCCILLLFFVNKSSAIKGFPVECLVADSAVGPCILKVKKGHRHIIFTAETHNFPTGMYCMVKSN